MYVCNECQRENSAEVVNFNDGRTVCWICLSAGLGAPVDSPAVDETEALRIMNTIQAKHDGLAKATNMDWFVAHRLWQMPLLYAADVLEGLVLAESVRGNEDGYVRTWIEEREYRNGDTINLIISEWDGGARD
jgi:hypothetical protein